jgi:polyhydroxybutyrate depolymerase
MTTSARHHRQTLIAMCSVALVTLLAACGGTDQPTSAPTIAATEPAAKPGPGDHELTLPWDGKQREYLLHAPPGYTPDKPMPLVLAFHPYPGTGRGVRVTSGLDALADKHGFLVAYPNGLAGGFNALVCCGAEDDVGFVGALVGHLTKNWGGDPDRVYATGISNGADLSFRLAIELPGVFAAVAPVSGGFGGPKAADPTYAPKSPVSVLTFIGGKDRFLGQFETGLTNWQTRSACPPRAATPVRGGTGITRTVAPCGNGSEFVTYRLPEMGHSWPGATEGGLAGPDAGINASELIWEFFQAHPRRS